MSNQEQQLLHLRSLLQQPRDSGEIGVALGVTQPTVSRLLRKIPEVLPLGAARARKYALVRQVPGVDQPIPVTEISSDGELRAMGAVHALQGGWYAFTGIESNEYQLYKGLPFFLIDLWPQGFLGRVEPLRNLDLDLPRDIQRWGAEHFLKYLSQRGENAPGNLILGNETQARYLQDRSNWQRFVMAEADRIELYPQLAQAAMQGEAPGSSAGGEQPKFTGAIERGADSEVNEHVIVKFSPPVGSASGRRWADLLICEHLALNVLTAHGIAAARTQVLEFGGRVFLEVVRFDRQNLFGRLPMVTFAGLDGDLGMADQTWTAVAHALRAQSKLPAGDVATVEVLDLYGALIGNEDKHHGNIAVSWTFEEQYRLLPSYDMLPMLYRPNTHGEIVPREWNIASTRKLQLVHLPRCFDMAQDFWNRVLADERISADFKAVAARHRKAIEMLNPGVGRSELNG